MQRPNLARPFARVKCSNTRFDPALLNDNMHRSIIIAKAGWYWIYAYLYAKKDRENIAPDELLAFKKLAKDYASASDAKFEALLDDKELLEICHDD